MSTCHVCGAAASKDFYYLGVAFRLCDRHYRLEIQKEKLLVKAGFSEGENLFTNEVAFEGLGAVDFDALLRDFLKK